MQRSVQSGRSSLHVSDWHILHVTGHCVSMKPGLDWHSPMAAHVAQLELVSSHAFAFFGFGLLLAQMWQLARHLECMNPLLRSHSAARAHCSHDSSSSTQLGSTMTGLLGDGFGGEGGLGFCCCFAGLCFLAARFSPTTGTSSGASGAGCENTVSKPACCAATAIPATRIAAQR